MKPIHLGLNYENENIINMDNDPLKPLVEEISRRISLNLAEVEHNHRNRLDDSIRTIETHLNAKLIDLENKLKSEALSNKPREIIIEDKRKNPPETLNIGQQHKMFPLLLSYTNLGLPSYINGPTGSGKTQGAFKVAESLKLACYRLALCSQTSKSEIMGYNDAHGHYVSGVAYTPYIEGGVLVLDELDNGNANVNSVLNMLTDGNDCVFPCGRKPRHTDFRVITTANTIGNGATRQYVGRSPQDKALLNRLVNIHWDYDQDLEKQLALVEWLSYGGNQTDESLKILDKKINDFWRMRKAIDELNIDHILSTRNLLQIIRLSASGVDINDITRSVIVRGLDKDQFIKIRDKANSLANAAIYDIEIKKDTTDDINPIRPKRTNPPF